MAGRSPPRSAPGDRKARPADPRGGRRGRGALGLYHQLTWAWLAEDARWVPVEDVYSQPHEGTTGVAPGIWNTNCVNRHSTGPDARLTRTVAGLAADTRAGELGIACEACHGPGLEHVEANQNPLRRYLQQLTGRDDPTIVNPEDLGHERANEFCAQCHAGYAARVEAHTHHAWGGSWQAAWLARSLDDPYASVRYLAGRSLALFVGVLLTARGMQAG